MKEYLAQIGLDVIPASHQTKSSVQLYYINNVDGTPRWIWTAKSRKAHFLKFYAISSFRSRVFAFAYQLVFLLQLQHLFFSRKSVYVTRNESAALSPVLKNNFALFTGTKGPNRKMVLYVIKENVSTSFYKIALSNTSELLLATEYKKIQEVEALNPKSFKVPTTAIVSNGILEMEDLSNQSSRKNNFTPIHLEALAELFTATVASSNTSTLPCFKAAAKQIEASKNGRIPQGIISRLETLQLHLENQPVFTTLSHKDFTPWNCLVQNNQLAMYDWELAASETPAAFDLFHFIMQTGILVNHANWRTIKEQLQRAFIAFASEVKTIKATDFDAYLSYYLYINTAYYIQLYAQQEEWHLQVDWLLAMWNEALNDVLQKYTPSREVLINTLFDYLINTQYAAIKFPNTLPHLLSEYADIDLCMQKSDAYQLIAYLKQNSLVQKARIVHKSYMASVTLQLRNNSLLCLDLIWQFKCKSIQFFALEEVLQKATWNAFGVKNMSEEHTRNYLRYFYGLNNAQVPEKYSAYFLPYKTWNSSKQLLLKYLKTKPYNMGISSLKNQLNYVLDAVKSIGFHKGIIITFSGVDGAGKSTVIAEVKHEMEKKLRKKVVVIRHRPSLLPILSAITKGKQNAEQAAMQTLPRQGKNKALISSLLRFAYYYTDYFIGQFIVYIKYVMRGEVVLYDRYYFDFINDSIRSNIRLPKWFTKLGYYLLMKPQLNFFLYADAKVILQRKQELELSTIKQLTNDYLLLFGQLGSAKQNQYVPIENMELNKTVALISHLITQKLA